MTRGCGRRTRRGCDVGMTAQDKRELVQALNGAIGQALDRWERGRPAVGAQTAPASALDRPHQPLNADQKAETERIAAAASTSGGQDFEALYARIKRRLIDEARVDPVLLHLLTKGSPEMVVHIEPRIEEVTATTLRGRVARLMAAGWFAGARATSAVRKELARTGTDPGGGGTLGDVLSKYVVDGFLTRDGDGYLLAPGVKVTEHRLEA